MLPVQLDSRSVDTHGYGKAGNYVTFKVTDSGTGIPSDKMQFIFEPFFTTKEQGKGTGLGLSIVYGIVKQHEGYVQAEVTNNSGTTFTIYLPEVSTEIPASDSDGTTAIVHGEETILVAEDDDAVRASLVYTLKHHGYNVIEAEDGQSAVETLIKNGNAIRLVTLDLIMPGQSGKETFKQLREIRPAIPIIFLTGYANDVNRCDELIDENTVLLMKPVESPLLTETINRLLALRTEG